MLGLRDWISKKLQEVAEKLPTQIHNDPASFACGVNTGYKQALLDLDYMITLQHRCSMDTGQSFVELTFNEVTVKIPLFVEELSEKFKIHPDDFYYALCQLNLDPANKKI